MPPGSNLDSGYVIRGGQTRTAGRSSNGIFQRGGTDGGVEESRGCGGPGRAEDPCRGGTFCGEDRAIVDSTIGTSNSNSGSSSITIISSSSNVSSTENITTGTTSSSYVG